MTLVWNRWRRLPLAPRALCGASALLLCLLSGCAARRSGDAVRQVKFTVEGRPFPRSLWAFDSNRALRRVMDQRTSRWQSRLFPGVAEPEWLDRNQLKSDKQRLEVFYQEHGYLDATVQRWEIDRHGSADRRVRSVDVRGHIDRGEASLVRKVTLTGLDDVNRSVARKARRASALAEGRVFTTADYTSSVTAIRSTLLAGGYAFATESGGVDAWPAERAVDVHIDVKPGPLSTFGPITITGVSGLPRKIVEDAVAFEEGDRFSPRALADTRTAFFALRVFSTVNVTPTLDDPESAVVPVAIEVKNTKWRRIKAGPAFAIEPGKATAYGAAEWENNNLWHRLWRFDQSVEVGVAGVYSPDTTPSTFDRSQVTIAPVVDLGSALTIPHVFGREWSLHVDGRVQVGVEQGYRFFSPEIAPSLNWEPAEHLTLSFGYRLRYFDYFAFTMNVQDIIDSPLGLDLTDPYLLSLLEQRVTWDRRDDPLSPTRGTYLSLGLAEAGGPVLGNFNFVRVQSEARGYFSLPKIRQWSPRLVIAGRIGAGLIAPYGRGSKATVPYAERLYLGGGTTVRGWGPNRLGPSTTTADISTGVTQVVPAGGLLDGLGNLELRKGVVGNLSVAAFTDVGRVWADPQAAQLAGLQWSVGGGLRYNTAIGPVRVDAGFRLGDDPAFADQRRWALHFGLSEAF